MKHSKRWWSIFEACLWTCSYQVLQAVVLALFLALLITAGYGFHWPPQSEIMGLALELNLDRSFLLIGVTSLGVLFLIVPMVRVRLGRDFRKIIGWRTPRHEEVIFAVATVIPIAILGDLLYELSRSWWATGPVQHLFSQAVQSSSLDYLRSTFEGVSFPVLIVALALGPAIGEELIFRGVIGRGLVQRFGPWSGSIITAILFAFAHVSPSHAVATLPIAFLLQFLYIKTGTIWIPILVHFCNNLLAVSMMRFDFVPEIPVTPLIAFGFLSYLFTILATYESRRRSWVAT